MLSVITRCNLRARAVPLVASGATGAPAAVPRTAGAFVSKATPSVSFTLLTARHSNRL
jgi:hypothetical protein